MLQTTMQCNYTIYVHLVEQRRHYQGEARVLDINTSLGEHGVMRIGHEDNVELFQFRPKRQQLLIFQPAAWVRFA